jgi:hypothetical protein
MSTDAFAVFVGVLAAAFDAPTAELAGRVHLSVVYTTVAMAR